MGRDLIAEIERLPEEERKAIEERATEIREEIQTLRELRSMAQKSQVEVAKALETSQPAVSRMERGADMFLSTLRGYVESLGGELDLIVRLPNKRPVHLKGLGDLHERRTTDEEAAH